MVPTCCQSGLRFKLQQEGGEHAEGSNRIDVCFHLALKYLLHTYIHASLRSVIFNLVDSIFVVRNAMHVRSERMEEGGGDCVRGYSYGLSMCFYMGCHARYDETCVVVRSSKDGEDRIGRGLMLTI